METGRFQVNGFEVLAVPVLYDNFVYLVCREHEAVLIDAGEAQPVFQALEENGLRLQKLLITHTHHDHIGGCRAIQDRLGVQSTSPGIESGTFPMLGTVCESISTPGHTGIHKVYHFPELGILFAGDTLINGACGRILDGTAEQLLSSLRKICEMPDETRIFGGHDYLVKNMEFALSVEPDNKDVKARLDLYRTDPASAIFATLAEEKKTNPFLRVDTCGEFADLRERKDCF
ncbi:MAG: MBL fold metallo-hydrolase [Verrucomicrobia bacterium]|nr:MBL fold metallo-hydrolase [Verrucomicrobiota bacterium]